MLDQNTDRMWFVIGAVIVGAAIIFIANGTLPDVFASVTDTFKASSEQATNVVSEIEPLSIMDEEGYLNLRWIFANSYDNPLKPITVISAKLQLDPNTLYEFTTSAPIYEYREGVRYDNAFVHHVGEQPETGDTGFVEGKSIQLMTDSTGIVELGLRQERNRENRPESFVSINDFLAGDYWIRAVKQ